MTVSRSQTNTVSPEPANVAFTGVTIQVQWVRIADQPVKRLYFFGKESNLTPHHCYITMDGTGGATTKAKEVIASWHEGVNVDLQLTDDATIDKFDTKHNHSWRRAGAGPWQVTDEVMGTAHRKVVIS